MSMSVPGNSCRPCRSIPVTPGCTIRLPGECVYYSGAPISGPGINTGDIFNIVVNKLANNIPPPVSVEAVNGVSISSSKVVLGQDNNATGDPALLTSDREIPMAGRHLALTSGTFSLGYSTPPITHFNTQQIVGSFGVTTSENLGFPIQGFVSNLPGTAYVMHSSSNWGLVVGRLDNSTSAANLTFYRSYGTDATVRTPISAGTTIGRLNFHGVALNTSVATAASIVVQSATVSNSFISGNIQFITTNLAGVNNLSAVISANGNLLLDGNLADNESRLNVRQVNTGNNAFHTAQFTGDWNTTGTPTLIYGNIIDTASNANSLLLDLQTNSVSKFKVSKQGLVGVDLGITNPSAKLHLGAGTATAGTAPVKLTSGVNLTTPEDGTIEYDGSNLYFTVGATRKTIGLNDTIPLKYVVLLSQSGTSNPVPTILENTLGPIVWTRNGVGDYTGTLAGAFTANKTFILITQNDELVMIDKAQLNRQNANTVLLATIAAISNSDNWTNLSIEIRVYP